ncbi:MAG: sensor domain-containing diguanylate cyclase, partial [Rhodoferax sp.]|nr:sensor domain-containing diguanylate cyclase [Rhodoferax sp.]
MHSSHRVFHGRRLLILLSILLSFGFFATTLGSYLVSKDVIREAILGRELPLASSNIYVELQKDLVQPVVISSTMAHDTFLRDWVLRGERDVSEMNRYLEEVKTRYGAFSSFFVSDRSLSYYTGGGVLKKVSPTEPRDAWYYRVRDLKEAYEINVDPDLANQDAMTIFINYRVFDFDGNYLGATGIGLTMDAMYRRIKDYQHRYQRTIYFVNEQGQVVLRGQNAASQATDLRTSPGLRDIIDQILEARNGGYQYEANGTNHLLNVHYIPELKWYLFVEKDESEALVKIRQTLYINLGVCLVITLVVLMLTNLSLSRYQRRLENMASTDKLTGMLNRQAFTILMDKLMADCARSPRPLSILMIDLDHFKRVNDQHGHAVGDQVLCLVADVLQQSLRKSDIAVRWGGEEFLVVLDNCAIDEARLIAEKIRERIAQAHLALGEAVLVLQASVGVSQLRPEEGLDQAIQRADGGLYQAKHGGRNQVGVFAE